MNGVAALLAGTGIARLVLFWLIAANLIGFLLMVRDKYQAANGGRRIPEKTLILWSFIGGSLGTLAAQRLIHHKIRKQPIATLLWLIPLLQCVTLILTCATGPHRLPG